MLATGAPAKIPYPWATSAAGSLVTSISASLSSTGSLASWLYGWVQANDTPLASGGTPPQITIANGAMLQVSGGLQALQAGLTPSYDSTFSGYIGGYPKGALLASTTQGLYWISTADNNTTNPDSSGSNWELMFGNAILGLVPGMSMPATTNANTPVLGLSTIGPTAGNTPFFGDYGILLTISSAGSATPAANNAIRQEAYDISAAQPVPQWFRTNINNGGWSAWDQVAVSNGNSATAFNVANAVSATEAVALQQFQTSNANPGYSIMPDGAIWQTGTMIIPAGTNEVSAALAIPWPNGYIGGAASDTGSGAFGVGVSAGVDTGHINLFCNVNQIISGAISARGTMTATYVVKGH